MKTKFFLKSALIIIGTAFSLFIFSRCSSDSDNDQNLNGELFWVDAGISKMPVFLSGNSQSNTILLIIHGGPGGSSIEMRGVFEGAGSDNLADDFLIASWDQRFAGFSKNLLPDDTTTANVEKYAEDCSKVI